MQALRSTDTVFAGRLSRGAEHIDFAVRPDSASRQPYRFANGQSVDKQVCAGLFIEYDGGSFALRRRIADVIDRQAPDAHCSQP